ncbi:MAG: arsenate reductase (azurin) small subunit [Hydrogenophilales bacterium 17-61-9]|nr:MAG: arsenate reductase (azurin) small subunit [Hydrogenophilales bacterium 17-61-9]
MTQNVSRRDFFKLSGGLAAGAGVAVAGLAPATAEAAPNTSTTLPYPAKVVTKAGGMKVNEPVVFNYPDASSPCQAIRMGQPVTGGVGPARDIVAYSILCTHQGCPTAYDSKDRCFKCPCHFSIFDAEKSGQTVCGQAPTKLPRIVLEYNARTDSVTAVAVDGLIYGRQANVL